MDDTYFLSRYSEEMVEKNNVKREYIQDEGTKLDFYNGYRCRFGLTCVTGCQLQRYRKRVGVETTRVSV